MNNGRKIICCGTCRLTMQQLNMEDHTSAPYLMFLKRDGLNQLMLTLVSQN